MSLFSLSLSSTYLIPSVRSFVRSFVRSTFNFSHFTTRFGVPPGYTFRVRVLTGIYQNTSQCVRARNPRCGRASVWKGIGCARAREEARGSREESSESLTKLQLRARRVERHREGRVVGWSAVAMSPYNAIQNAKKKTKRSTLRIPSLTGVLFKYSEPCKAS